MKKRLLPILLALMLVCTLLPAAASASGGAYVVQLSDQALTVNGRPIECEKYNIDGANYFKLRDIAYLLNGTEYQFLVGWDANTNTVAIGLGQPYTPVGGELDMSGGDKSATAQRSPQRIIVGLDEVDNLDVFNIGGNNYFKLRDLAAVVGFNVDYDEATRTVLVTSPGEGPAPEGPRSTLTDGSYAVLFDTAIAEEAGGTMVGICQMSPDGADVMVDTDGWLYFPDTLSIGSVLNGDPEQYTNLNTFFEAKGIDNLGGIMAGVTIYDGSVTNCTLIKVAD